jgi:GNAT superfamily N-acetyltransferase
VYEITASGNAFHARPPMFTPYVEPWTEAAVRTELREALADEGQAIHLASIGSKAVGVLWVQGPKGSPFFTPDDACYIGDTAVLPGARGSGAGAAMLDSALAWARERGYRHATLHFVPANPLSSAFWKGQGFVPVMYHLRRHIDERILWAKPAED